MLTIEEIKALDTFEESPEGEKCVYCDNDAIGSTYIWYDGEDDFGAFGMNWMCEEHLLELHKDMYPRGE